MRVVIQRVSEAAVSVNAEIIAKIVKGLVVLVGIESTDGPPDVDWLSHKIVEMRIFDDENGVMNKSIKDIYGEILLISQFTLHASTKKGNRPSYIQAAEPGIALGIYQTLIQKLSLDLGKDIATGQFGADMKVALVNDGPVTIIMDSKNKQ